MTAGFRDPDDGIGCDWRESRQTDSDLVVLVSSLHIRRLEPMAAVAGKDADR